jgi:photosystem I subunit III
MQRLLKKFFSKTFLSFAFAISIFFTMIPVSSAEFNLLTPCKDSKAFQKRSLNTIKKLENRLKLYDISTKEAKSLEKQIEATKNRFKNYSNSTLLCGKDGLPRIIATGQWNHANEFIIPSIIFLYITGWIGWVGRKYLKYSNTTENSFENEIIINIPIAIKFITSGFLWPIESWKEFINKELIASNNEITISPR